MSRSPASIRCWPTRILQYLEQLNKTDGTTVICSCTSSTWCTATPRGWSALKDGVKVFEGLPQEIDRAALQGNLRRGSPGSARHRGGGRHDRTRPGAGWARFRCCCPAWARRRAAIWTRGLAIFAGVASAPGVTVWYGQPGWLTSCPPLLWLWNIWDAVRLPSGAPMLLAALLWLGMAYGIGVAGHGDQPGGAVPEHRARRARSCACSSGRT